jgi:hypothetical protein
MNQNALKQPFIAALLEKQMKTHAPEEQIWPWPPKPTFPALDYDQTMKYPSDGDEETA